MPSHRLLTFRRRLPHLPHVDDREEAGRSKGFGSGFLLLLPFLPFLLHFLPILVPILCPPFLPLVRVLNVPQKLLDFFPRFRQLLLGLEFGG